METAIVAGRIEVGVKEKATKYIHAAGLTVGDVIRNVMETIAKTGSIPECSLPAKASDEQADRLRAFAELRKGLPACPELAEMTDADVRNIVAQRLGQGF